MFDISGMGDGFCLQSPMMTDFSKVMPMKRQGKIAAALKEYSDWCSIINIESIGTLNKAVKDGKAVSIINLAEIPPRKELRKDSRQDLLGEGD